VSGARTVLIVGGGVIGLCAAWYALQKGHRVILLERGGPGHDSCSLGNGGMIVPSHFVPLAAPGMVSMGLRMMFNPESPFWIRPRLDRDLLSWGWKFLRAANARHVERAAPILRDLNLESRRCYAELAEQPGLSFGLVQKGLLMLCKTEPVLQEEAALAERARQLGLEAEVLTAAQTARLDPNIRMDIAGAVHFPQDCHLVPQQFMAEMTQRLEKEGASLVWSAEVTGWRTTGRRVEAALVGAREFTADEYVIAGGAWSPAIARGLQIDMPMQAGKGYSLTLPDPPQLPSICSILTEARVAVTPMDGALRFAGTMEITGLDQSVNPARVNGILKSIPRYFPAFSPDHFRGIAVWSGLRPCSPDGLPYIGRFGRYDNLLAAAGHAMMGLSLGPITGRLIAEILASEPPSIPLNLLSPDRYA
jgi:D-amino-acid dehydrogenase